MDSQGRLPILEFPTEARRRCPPGPQFQPILGTPQQDRSPDNVGIHMPRVSGTVYRTELLFIPPAKEYRMGIFIYSQS